MTRAELLKRKYAIIRNITGDSALSNKAKHWGNEKIFNELNINISKYINKPKSKLKPTTKFQRNRLLKSAENKYKYAIKMGVSPENAEIIKYQPYKVIDLQIRYQLFFKTKYKRLSSHEKNDRIDEWRAWSSEDIYPPLLVRNAREINLKSNLDINDSYGFGIMYYVFTTNKSPEFVMDQYAVDKNTGRIIYKTLGGAK